MSLKDLVNLYQLGAGFYESLLKAASAVERRISRTPTANVFDDRSVLWRGVIDKNILSANSSLTKRKAAVWGYNDEK